MRFGPWSHWHGGCCGIGFLAALAATVFWIWAMIDCATKEPNEGNDKIIWILVILFTHFVGALLYVLIRRPERLRRYNR